VDKFVKNPPARAPKTAPLLGREQIDERAGTKKHLQIMHLHVLSRLAGRAGANFGWLLHFVE